MVLRNQEVSLRPLQREDREAMAILLNNKNVWNNLRDLIPFPYSGKDAALFISQVEKNADQYTFAITYREEFVGVIGLVPQRDVYRKSFELGYWIGEPFWNKGIASKAVNLIKEYAFEQFDINRIFCSVYEYNPASMKVLEKCGFIKEGVLQKSAIKNGEFLDEVRYAILKD